MMQRSKCPPVPDLYGHRGHRHFEALVGGRGEVSEARRREGRAERRGRRPARTGGRHGHG